MPIAWYLCAYTVTKQDAVTSVPDGQRSLPIGVCRTLPIHTYIPAIPNADGATWSEIEIMGNTCLVKVDAPTAIHTAIAADPAIFAIPNRTLTTTVPTNRRTAVSTKLQGLGYTTAEITGTNWNVDALLTLLTSGASPVVLNATADGITIQPGRGKRTRAWQAIDQEIPG
jgi:hypothetical protein